MSYKVPTYSQAELMEKSENELQFPFNDEYMCYDELRHEYKLTDASLVKYGIDVSEMQPVEKQEFLRKVSRAVYSLIKEKAELKNYYKMIYRIAKGLGAPQLLHIFNSLVKYGIIKLNNINTIFRPSFNSLVKFGIIKLIVLVVNMLVSFNSLVKFGIIKQ